MLKGAVECSSVEVAISQLRQQGYTLVDIRPASSSAQARSALKQDLAHLFRKKIGSSKLAVLTQQFATLINAGIPIDRSLEILVRATDQSHLKVILQDLLDGVKKGKPLSDAMGAHPEVFAPFYRSMVHAGEQSATLGQVLARVAEIQTRLAEIKSTVISSLVYPSILLIASGLSVLLLMTYVVPRFVEMFAEVGTDLPFSTRMLMSVSDLLRSSWWIFLLGAVGAYLGIKRVMLNPAIRYRWDCLKLRLPLFGRMTLASEISRFSRTLATLLASGIPLLAATAIVRSTVGNLHLLAILEEAEGALKAGHSFSQALSRKEFFPPMAMQMISVGEESGELQMMLMRVADEYEKELNALIKRALILIEPLIILVMGLVVGFVVLSMLAAVFGIHDVVR